MSGGNDFDFFPGDQNVHLKQTGATVQATLCDHLLTVGEACVTCRPTYGKSLGQGLSLGQ